MAPGWRRRRCFPASLAMCRQDSGDAQHPRQLFDFLLDRLAQRLQAGAGNEDARSAQGFTVGATGRGEGGIEGSVEDFLRMMDEEDVFHGAGNDADGRG